VFNTAALKQGKTLKRDLESKHYQKCIKVYFMNTLNYCAQHIHIKIEAISQTINWTVWYFLQIYSLNCESVLSQNMRYILVKKKIM